MTRMYSLGYMSLAILAISSLSSSALAQHLFRFEQHLSKKTLAILELRALPATSLDDFVGLRFTEAGDTLLGFGAGEYQGEFNVKTGDQLDLVKGQLSGIPISAFQFFDTDPPPSRRDTGVIEEILTDSIFTDRMFWLSFNGQSLGGTNLIFRNGRGGTLIGGRFIPIPEPASSNIVLTIVFSGFIYRMSRPFSPRIPSG